MGIDYIYREFTFAYLILVLDFNKVTVCRLTVIHSFKVPEFVSIRHLFLLKDYSNTVTHIQLYTHDGSIIIVVV